MLTTLLYHFAFAQMCFCVLILLKQFPRSQPVWFFILLMGCGCGYVLGRLYSSPESKNIFLVIDFITSNALLGVFWLVSYSVFGENKRFRTWHYLVGSSTLLLPVVVNGTSAALNFDMGVGGILVKPFNYIQLVLELGLLLHALCIAITHWRDDLVQERRYIRGAVLSLAAIYIGFIIIFEQVLQLSWQGFEPVKGVLLVLLVTVINFFLVDVKYDVFFASKEPKVPESTDLEAQPRAELKRILTAMEAEKFYQQEGLTIAKLAKHVSIHEYKLRNIINGELNYRNFNDFLNYYRIKEVTEKLELLEFNQIPVLTMALESGFRSLSSFNKAFKETHGKTPTEYRKHAIG
ncbi:AraC family transcriptional regulator [Shewanella sp. 202IG2-18]|uniref:helix-turn-helix domain-containing protein n=1 Tax=Parashewanella hymeniacidonis TaxID=2807618 RepID=UPI001960EEC1|nr:helix-turn-helix domain-containing protein [Parashewanella hymeniacidonis]MBM7072202.1 AraC family transcriptional regulator [Parashewanella hymeniacidonis]